MIAYQPRNQSSSLENLEWKNAENYLLPKRDDRRRYAGEAIIKSFRQEEIEREANKEKYTAEKAPSVFIRLGNNVYKEGKIVETNFNSIVKVVENKNGNKFLLKIQPTETNEHVPTGIEQENNKLKAQGHFIDFSMQYLTPANRYLRSNTNGQPAAREGYTLMKYMPSIEVTEKLKKIDDSRITIEIIPSKHETLNNLNGVQLDNNTNAIFEKAKLYFNHNKVQPGKFVNIDGKVFIKIKEKIYMSGHSDNGYNGEFYPLQDANGEKIGVKIIGIDTNGPSYHDDHDTFIRETAALNAMGDLFAIDHITLDKNEGFLKQIRSDKIINEKYFLLIRLHPGKDFRKTFMLDKTKNYSKLEKLKAALDCARRIQFLHEEKHIIHGDIKPDNIMYDPKTGKTALVDWGHAMQLKPGQEIMEHKAHGGWQPYCAPEVAYVMNGFKRIQLYQGNGDIKVPYTYRYDMYSFGVVLEDIGLGDVMPELLSGNEELDICFNYECPHGENPKYQTNFTSWMLQDENKAYRDYVLSAKDKRPTARQAVERLEYLVQLEEKKVQSNNNLFIEPKGNHATIVQKPLLLSQQSKIANNSSATIINFSDFTPVKIQQISQQPVVIQESKDLIHAAYMGELEKVEKFLSVRGIDPNCSNEYGGSALIYAAQNGYVAVIKKLLNARGIDLNQADKNGGTALIYAVQNGHLAVVNALLADNRTDPTQADKAGIKPMQYAMDRNQQEMVEALKAAMSQGPQIRKYY